MTVHGPIEDPEPKIIKDHLDKKSKFWFMKPGALNGALNTTSPYHTIQLGSHIPPPTSSKGNTRDWCKKKRTCILGNKGYKKWF